MYRYSQLLQNNLKPTLSKSEVLKRAFSKDIPETCNQCVVICCGCVNIKHLGGRDYPDLNSSLCKVCIDKPKEMEGECFVLNKLVNLSDKPKCTKADIFKKLVEVL